MRDVADWSHPWHELQRSLAAGFGAHAGGRAAGHPQTAPKVSGLCSAIPPAASWLVRARTGVYPTVSSAAR
jgi:hypothetical protein